MRNIESHPHFEEFNLQREIEKHVEVLYSPEKLTTAYVNRMFGLEDGQLSDDEIAQLGKFFNKAGNILIRSNLEKQSLESFEEVKEAIRKHAKNYSKFGAHDLVHIVVESALEGESIETESNSPAIPEFLKETVDNKQAIREEFPAVLWTPIGESKPIFIDLISGNSEGVVQTLRNSFDGSKVDKIKNLVDATDFNDFESVCKTYTEILLYLTYKVAKMESGLEGAELNQWKENYNQDQNEIKLSIEKQVREFITNGKFAGDSKGDRTEQLFISQAHSIFKNFSEDQKISFKNFISLSKPLMANEAESSS